MISYQKDDCFNFNSNYSWNLSKCWIKFQRPPLLELSTQNKLNSTFNFNFNLVKLIKLKFYFETHKFHHIKKSLKLNSKLTQLNLNISLAQLSPILLFHFKQDSQQYFLLKVFSRCRATLQPPPQLLLEYLACFQEKNVLVLNKPFFCSGSCDEIYATTKLRNKTSLKYSWNTLETLFEIF